MKVSDFYYDLPTRLIAQRPLEERTQSRLLVLDKGQISHGNFTDIINYLEEGDCLVLNDTKVIPARLYGYREDSKAEVEIVLIKSLSSDKWEAIVRPGKKLRQGHTIVFGDNLLKAKILDVLDNGNRVLEFTYEGIFEELLDIVGIVPLPPYIKEKLDDPDRYQTVYARIKGSAAAPTAGLHFTRNLLDKIKEKGIKIAYVTLHVGLGTFRPVKTKTVEDHYMHTEYYEISKENADTINNAKEEGKRVIAVGTTSTRVLESATNDQGLIEEKKGETNIFIYPGYKFKMVDSLITNFHLPESTLLMLVSAFSGRENILKAYQEAIDKEYRFFSFGDAMFLK